MEYKVRPIVGEWYQTREGMDFEVVALDQDERTVEIQYFDGAIEELDFSNWVQMPLRVIQPPEDWSGAVDVMREDFISDTGMTSQESWVSPQDALNALVVDEL